jgi:uncharacterized protein (DUF488 family)
MKPAPETTSIISIGYEQRTVTDLIAVLRDHKVDVLVDVRLNPISRKRGFSKKALAWALDEADIGYRHERELGNPKENRDLFRQGVQSARERYLVHLRNGASEAYDSVIQLAYTSRIALLCYERSHHECHRSCILEAAQDEHPGITFEEA